MSPWCSPQISQVAMNAHMAMLNITGLTFMTGPMAFGIAANVRVGNLLGAGSGFRAKVASRVSVALGVAMACMASAHPHLQEADWRYQSVIKTTRWLCLQQKLHQ